MASMLTCEICLEKKTDRNPKSLRCLHLFCRECLSSWVDTLSKGCTIKCPVCQQNTKLPFGGIDGLVDDFKVLQLEEIMKSIGDPFVCQGCLVKGETSKAQVNCVTCNRRLCGSCLDFHSKKEIFKNHKIATDMCEVQGNAVSHVCVTCFTGICIDCVFSEVHDTHELCEVDEGIGKLRDCVEESQRQLRDIRSKISLRMKTTEIKTGQDMDLNIVKLKQAAGAMKQEIDRQVTEVTKQYMKQTLQDMKKSFEEFEKLSLSMSLDGLEQKNLREESMAKIVELNTELNKTIRQVRAAEGHVPEKAQQQTIKDILKEVGKPLSLQDNYDTNIKSDVEIKLRDTLCRDISGKPKPVYQKLSSECKEIGSPRGLEIMDDFTAIAGFLDQDHVARFDKKGKVVASYYCNGSGDANKVCYVNIGGGNIYILYKDLHTVIHVSAGGFERNIRHVTNIPENIVYFTFDHYSNTFLLSQASGHGKVFRWRKTDISPEECTLAPGRIRVLPYAGSYRTVVASFNTNTVMVYDADETLLYTLTGCGDKDHFNCPVDVSMLGDNTLLVADHSKCRVCKFRLSDGSFKGLLLTEEDNVSPIFIACKYPYLLVAGFKRGTLVYTLQLYKLRSVNMSTDV